jgi:hypothetical protein
VKYSLPHQSAGSKLPLQVFLLSSHVQCDGLVCGVAVSGDCRWRKKLVFALPGSSGNAGRVATGGVALSHKLNWCFCSVGVAGRCQGEFAMVWDTGLSSRGMIRVATAALLSFALSLPAAAQFWGNSWGWRQQPTRHAYNPYGGFGGYSQWGTWGYRPRVKIPLPPEGTGTPPGGRERAAAGLLPRSSSHVTQGCGHLDPGHG